MLDVFLWDGMTGALCEQQPETEWPGDSVVALCAYWHEKQ